MLIRKSTIIKSAINTKKLYFRQKSDALIKLCQKGENPADGFPLGKKLRVLFEALGRHNYATVSPHNAT